MLLVSDTIKLIENGKEEMYEKVTEVTPISIPAIISNKNIRVDTVLISGGKFN